MARSSRSVASLAVISTLLVSGCSAGAEGGKDADPQSGTSATPSQVSVGFNVRGGAQAAPLDRPVVVRADRGTLRSVRLATGAGTAVAGAIGSAGKVWRSSGPLQPETRYVVTVTAADTEGRTKQQTTRFRTRALSKAEQTYPSFVPTESATVGVAMPVIVRFDLAVQDKAAFERRMKVTSQPSQPGAWHWISDKEAHWRPRTYWQPGTRVSAKVDVGGVPAGDGIYGQLDRTLNFTVGRSQIVKVDAASHRMRVLRGGAQVRDFPITTGKEGFITRSGTKVVMEKFPQRRMNSETIGIRQGSADAYDIDDVKWAMRLTYSGEFIHAAPWSVGSQGRANVSHGCTGMSPSDAKWLYDNTIIGDPVEYTGTDRPMTLTNGYGDWNADFGAWQAGSALS